MTILFGFLASSMHPKVDGIWFFGLTIPPMFGKDGDLAHTFIEIHGVMGMITLFLSFLHMAGVLKHRILKSEKEKDVLGRML